MHQICKDRMNIKKCIGIFHLISLSNKSPVNLVAEGQAKDIAISPAKLHFSQKGLPLCLSLATIGSRCHAKTILLVKLLQEHDIRGFKPSDNVNLNAFTRSSESTRFLAY